MARLPRRPMPLRWHLVLLVVGTLLPVVAFGVVVVYQLAANQRAAAERRLVQSVRDLGTALDREMSSTIRVLSALAQSERLDRGDLAGFGAEARRAAATQPWMTVLLLSPDGRQLVNTAGKISSRTNEPASLRHVLATRQPVVGDLAWGRLGRLAFPVRVPVIREGAVRYVLTAVVTPKALAEVVSRQFSPDEEWTRTLVDRTGRVAARTRDSQRFVGKMATSSYLLTTRRADQGLRRETTLEGEPVYMAFSRAPLSRWTAVIAVPVEVLEGPARRSALVMTGIGLLMLVASGVGAFLLSRHVSRSMASATSAATVLAHGGRPTVEDSGVAEVARLADALGLSADLLSQREQERNELLAHAQAARAEAEAANRAKDEFLAMLGHELRNPLGPIRNGIYLLRQLVPPNERLARVQDMIDRQVVHMTRLVDELLDASRVSRGKIVLQTEEIDLREVTRDVCEDFEPELARAEIALDLSLPGSPVPILGDRTRLAQSLGNLLHNASKFTPAGGRVTVTLAVEGELASLTVRDDGCGIDPDILPTLFQTFSQGPQPLDRSRGGLGLGLALVKGLVELHGGTVHAASEGAGKGTTFRIVLPVIPRAELASGSSASRSGATLR